MKKWQLDAYKKMKQYIQEHISGAHIKKIGSILEPDELDIYSDVDLHIHLPYEAHFNAESFIKKLNEQFHPVLGYEIHNNDKQSVLRICLNNGNRYDLTFNHEAANTQKPPNETFALKVNRTVNQFWFMASQVLVKLGRGDYLIAAHLALELCQLIIVVQMLDRDDLKGTNIHRFGDRENVPILHRLLMLEYSDLSSGENIVDEILRILFASAQEMDDIASRFDASYFQRTVVLGSLHSLYKHSVCEEEVGPENTGCI